MISGPYRHGSDDPDVWQENLNAMNRAAYDLFKKGHVPIIGVNAALPIIDAVGQEKYDEVMMPLSLNLTSRCDAVLRIGGASNGADREVQRFKERDVPVYTSLDEIPDDV
jgi:hypothetical protein